MDTGRIALKIQRAIGQQVYLFSIIFIFGIFAAIKLVNLASRPVAALLNYAVELARDGESTSNERILVREDEVGHLARLIRHLAGKGNPADPASNSAGSGCLTAVDRQAMRRRAWWFPAQ